MARLDNGQHQTDSFLNFGDVMDFFRGWNRPDKFEQAFIAAPTSAASQFIQTLSHGCPIQPACRFVAMSLRTVPKLQKHLHRKFLRARRIANNSGYDADDALKLGKKDCLDIEGNLSGLHLGKDFTSCVHTLTTPPEMEL